jgi:hypothetical protein
MGWRFGFGGQIFFVWIKGSNETLKNLSEVFKIFWGTLRSKYKNK